MTHLSRRDFWSLAVTGLALPTLVSGGRAHAAAPRDSSRVQAAIDRFAKITSAASCYVVGAGWQAGHRPAERLFVGSAVKTFILAQYLREVEARRLSEGQLMTIDDEVRSPSSPVFLRLSGTTAARHVLEAMIAHSDNTATDLALAAAGPANVRALIKEAGLGATRIPDSTRRLFVFLATGRNEKVSWAEVLRLLDKPTNVQPAINPTQTMVSTAHDMVAWYQAVLAGKFFKEPATLLEFKRIQAMADALIHVVPTDTLAYGKGGSLDWADFHCVSLPGQMIVRGVPVTFCFTINWTGVDQTVGPIFKACKDAVSAVLSEAAAVT